MIGWLHDIRCTYRREDGHAMVACNCQPVAVLA